jgi:hypothetical protein
MSHFDDFDIRPRTCLHWVRRRFRCDTRQALVVGCRAALILVGVWAVWSCVVLVTGGK